MENEKKSYLQATMAFKRTTAASINVSNNWNAYFAHNFEICDTVKSISKGVIGNQKASKSHKKHPDFNIWNRFGINIF